MTTARQRRLHFGIELLPQHVSFARLSDACHEAERLGFGSAWIFDHLMPVYSADQSGDCLECWSTIAAIAATTTRLRLGSFVACNSYRHPGLHAKIAATIDVISAGRLEFGFGAGWAETDYRAFGIPFPAPGERIRRLDEAVRLIKRLWTEPSVTFEGRYYQLRDARCEPKPVQTPHPPVWLGGRGERRTLRLVAEQADGWNMSLRGVDEYRHKVEVLAAHCESVGRDPQAISRSVHAPIVVREAEGELAAAAQAVNADGYLGRIGITQIVGTPDRCAEQLRPYVALGATHILLNSRWPYDYESWRLFIEKVVPLLEG